MSGYRSKLPTIGKKVLRYGYRYGVPGGMVAAGIYGIVDSGNHLDPSDLETVRYTVQVLGGVISGVWGSKLILERLEYRTGIFSKVYDGMKSLWRTGGIIGIRRIKSREELKRFMLRNHPVAERPYFEALYEAFEVSNKLARTREENGLTQSETAKQLAELKWGEEVTEDDIAGLEDDIGRLERGEFLTLFCNVAHLLGLNARTQLSDSPSLKSDE